MNSTEYRQPWMKVSRRWRKIKALAPEGADP